MTIVQKPNTPLIIAFAGFLISKYPLEIIQKLGNVIFTVAIIIWAYMEISSGVNLFRKILGWVVLILTAISLFGQV